MLKSLWFNLGVKDLERTVKFYREAGFLVDSHDYSSILKVHLPNGGIIIFFNNDTFKEVVPFPYEENSNEVLISLSVATREELHEAAEKVEKAGGRITEAPVEKNGFYGFGFADPDNHHFNVIVMEE